MAGRQIKIRPDGEDEIVFFPIDKLSKEEIDVITNLIAEEYMNLEQYERYDEEGNIVEEKYDWKDVVIDISKISTKKFSEVKPFPFGDVHELFTFNDGNDGYLNSYSELYYFAYAYYRKYKIYPSVYRVNHFDLNIFVKKLLKHFNIPDYSYIKISYQNSKEPRITSILFCLDEGLYMYIDGEDKGSIFYQQKDENNPDSHFYNLLGLLKGFKKPSVAKNQIFIVYRGSTGFDKMGFNVKKINVNLEENYNDDFPEMSEKIINGLNSKNKTNLVILSGSPGVGKTTYIRYLTSRLKKNIIFISPDMVDSITDPAFIPFLMQNNDSILIIEDAEPALEKRGTGGRSSAVSNVLNLTDGLLSDCLNISIVATFNTGIKNIDEALTRKGRLLMNYKFEKLSVEKSKKLLEKNGHGDVEVTEPMTLADIYFYGIDNNSKINEPRKLGF